MYAPLGMDRPWEQESEEGLRRGGNGGERLQALMAPIVAEPGIQPAPPMMALPRLGTRKFPIEYGFLHWAGTSMGVGGKVERATYPTVKMSKPSWNWPGSRWWRVDFHTHSPASYDFKNRETNTDDRERWVTWITAARDAGLDAVAITDHNTAEGIEPLKNACSQVENAPVLFPGVEITANDGCHLLLIMDPAHGRDHVNDFLSRVGIEQERRGTQKARSSQSVEGILEECDDKILILGAHVNSKDAGLLRHEGQQRIAELNHPRLAGVEVVPDYGSEDGKLLAPVDYEPWLDGSQAEIKRQFHPVWSSDAHCFADLGRRWTWVKMTSPTLEGLRLALLDGAGSLKPSQAKDDNHNIPPEMVIESITVDQGKFMGRPQAITIPLNPYLNTIIGGRGTGKSTIIDFCRMTLRRQDELENNEKGEGPLKDLFDRRMKIPKDRKGEGLLQQKTKAEIVYRKNGQKFSLSWSQDGSAHPIARVNEQDDSYIPEEGDIRERFPIRIYSQKQLFTLAQNPNALLSIIDDGIQIRGNEIKRKIEKFRNDYLSLRANARAALQEAETISIYEGSLRDLRHKINVLQAGNQAQIIKRHQQLHSKDSSWQQVLTEAMNAINSIRSQVSELTVADLTTDTIEDDQAQASLQKVHGSIKEKINGLRQDLLHRIDVTQNDIEQIREGDDARYWQNEVVSIQKKLEETMKNLTQQGIASPNEYSDLLRDAKSLEGKIQNCKNQRQHAEQLERDADEMLSRYRKSHIEMNNLRQIFLQKISAKSENLINIKVNQFSDDSDLTEQIGEDLGLNAYEKDREEIAKMIGPDKGKPWSGKTLDAVISDMRKLPSQQPTSWNVQDRRFLGALQKLLPERIDRLALYCPKDGVEVEFREGKGSSWKPLPQGSPGQQAAALLAFILGHGQEPIIIDQPEDDLDNALIYDLLVRRLREVKQHRQVIVVTHNPNIVVNGNAELVLSLKVGGGQTRIGCHGGIQDQPVRDEVCRVMEGGREALKRRYQWILLPERPDHAGS